MHFFTSTSNYICHSVAAYTNDSVAVYLYYLFMLFVVECASVYVNAYVFWFL